MKEYMYLRKIFNKNMDDLHVIIDQIVADPTTSKNVADSFLKTVLLLETLDDRIRDLEADNEVNTD